MRLETWRCCASQSRQPEAGVPGASVRRWRSPDLKISPGLSPSRPRLSLLGYFHPSLISTQQMRAAHSLASAGFMTRRLGDPEEREMASISSDLGTLTPWTPLKCAELHFVICVLKVLQNVRFSSVHDNNKAPRENSLQKLLLHRREQSA